jgi:hypothetical protein
MPPVALENSSLIAPGMLRPGSTPAPQSPSRSDPADHTDATAPAGSARSAVPGSAGPRRCRHCRVGANPPKICARGLPETADRACRRTLCQVQQTVWVGSVSGMICRIPPRRVSCGYVARNDKFGPYTTEAIEDTAAWGGVSRVVHIDFESVFNSPDRRDRKALYRGLGGLNVPDVELLHVCVCVCVCCALSTQRRTSRRIRRAVDESPCTSCRAPSQVSSAHRSY